VDVAFLGYTGIGATEPQYFKHRQTMLATLKAIASRHNEWTIVMPTEDANGRFVDTAYSAQEFRVLLGDVKVFVSPFGFGEWSMKDEEAALLGAVLLKPGASLLDATPGLYVPNVTCLDVRPDWLDLETALEMALSDTKRLQQIQDTARRTLTEYEAQVRDGGPLSTVESFADFVVAAFNRKRKFAVSMERLDAINKAVRRPGPVQLQRTKWLRNPSAMGPVTVTALRP